MSDDDPTHGTGDPDATGDTDDALTTNAGEPLPNDDFSEGAL